MTSWRGADPAVRLRGRPGVRLRDSPGRKIWEPWRPVPGSPVGTGQGRTDPGTDRCPGRGGAKARAAGPEDPEGQNPAGPGSPLAANPEAPWRRPLARAGARADRAADPRPPGETLRTEGQPLAQPREPHRDGPARAGGPGKTQGHRLGRHPRAPGGGRTRQAQEADPDARLGGPGQTQGTDRGHRPARQSKAPGADPRAWGTDRGPGGKTRDTAPGSSPEGRGEGDPAASEGQARAEADLEDRRERALRPGAEPGRRGPEPEGRDAEAAPGRRGKENPARRSEPWSMPGWQTRRARRGEPGEPGSRGGLARGHGPGGRLEARRGEPRPVPGWQTLAADSGAVGENPASRGEAGRADPGHGPGRQPPSAPAGRPGGAPGGGPGSRPPRSGQALGLPLRQLRLRSSRYSVTSALVDGSSPGTSALSVRAGSIRLARTLPSSTPHWSKESMFQTAPWTKTFCS